MGVSAAVAVFTYGTYKNIESQKKAQQATERAQQASQQQYVAESRDSEHTFCKTTN